MRKIGLVGGTGPESTVMYYKKLNGEIDRLTGGNAMPDIAIDSVDFHRAWDYVCNDKTDELADYLTEKLKALKAGGSEVISLTAVTMHMVFDKLERNVDFPIVSIPRTVSEEIVSQGIRRIGLLGTVFTMEKDYMKTDLIASGVEVYIPTESERQLIGKRIYEELERGIVKDSTLKELTDIITRMKNDDGIEGVILGCTELPLILNKENSPVACFDAVDIHIRKLIEMAMV